MPNQQCVLFFGDLAQSFGWTEVYWFAESDIAGAHAKMVLLKDDRINVLPDFYGIFGGRVSDVSITGDSLLLTGGPYIGAVGPATFADVCEPWTALLTREESTSLKRGRHFIHGIMQTTFTSNRQYNTTNPEALLWDTFMSFLVANTYNRIKTAGVYGYVPITDAFPLRMVERKVGRPFGLLHGRRPTTA